LPPITYLGPQADQHTTHLGISYIVERGESVEVPKTLADELIARGDYALTKTKLAKAPSEKE